MKKSEIKKVNETFNAISEEVMYSFNIKLKLAELQKEDPMAFSAITWFFNDCKEARTSK